MSHRWQFNHKTRAPTVVEGERVDLVGRTITVVGSQGESVASFAEADLYVWYEVTNGLAADAAKRH